MPPKSKKSQKSHGEGNTISLRKRRFCFTLNNWTEEEFIKSQNLKKCIGYCIGKELCPETGTPHLQGYWEFKSQKEWDVIKKELPRANFRECNGDREANIKYCTKNKNGLGYVNTFPMPFKERLRMKLMEEMPIMGYQWELDILEEIDTKPDHRKINWYWERTGNVGKTTFCKYLCLNHGAQILPTKTADAMHHIAKMLENEVIPELLIIDIPRSSMDFINYTAIEKIKDGAFTSGKYEGGMCLYPRPHVFVFANEPPNIDSMSLDKWNIVEIK